ncbi:MAG: S-layer homology domain-containing protein, partial [Actinomycetota bacterium]|nr:S-layer homology domain-containing protein [Actinomycetota bacterium]
TLTYRPLPSVNRDAMAAFLYRMAASPAYIAPTVSPFKDVSTGQQFYKEMAWVSEQGISTGWTEPDENRTYRALTPINRDAMAAFLYRSAGSPAYTAPTVSPFKDVSPGQQFYKEMAWVSEQGISTGWTEPDGTNGNSNLIWPRICRLIWPRPGYGDFRRAAGCGGVSLSVLGVWF